MISEARSQASRSNGCASRGPKTPEGKARSARNALRHGLSRPAGLDPALAKQIGALARAIAGPDAGSERFEMACMIAAAAIVMRVRRACADLLSTVPLDDAVLIRAVALDRYRCCGERGAGLSKSLWPNKPDARLPQHDLPNEPDRRRSACSVAFDRPMRRATRRFHFAVFPLY